MRDPATNEMKNEVLRRLSAEDADRILDLNNEHAVETSLLDLFAAERLLAMCFYAKCAGAGERGFLLALDQGAAYDNQNFRWFSIALSALCNRQDHHREGRAWAGVRAVYV
jgi:predicted GNAT superfamily acetyltransferase